MPVASCSPSMLCCEEPDSIFLLTSPEYWRAVGCPLRLCLFQAEQDQFLISGQVLQNPISSGTMLNSLQFINLFLALVCSELDTVPSCGLTSMQEWGTIPQPKGCIPILTWGSLAVLAARAHGCHLGPQGGPFLQSCFPAWAAAGVLHSWGQHFNFSLAESHKVPLALVISQTVLLGDGCNVCLSWPSTVVRGL